MRKFRTDAEAAKPGQIVQLIKQWPSEVVLDTLELDPGFKLEMVMIGSQRVDSAEGCKGQLVKPGLWVIALAKNVTSEVKSGRGTWTVQGGEGTKGDVPAEEEPEMPSLLEECGPQVLDKLFPGKAPAPKPKAEEPEAVRMRIGDAEVVTDPNIPQSPGFIPVAAPVMKEPETRTKAVTPGRNEVAVCFTREEARRLHDLLMKNRPIFDVEKPSIVRKLQKAMEAK
jgi:hypothetical protein